MSISLLPIYSFFHKEEVHLRAPIISLKKGDFLLNSLGYPIILLKKGDFLLDPLFLSYA